MERRPFKRLAALDQRLLQQAERLREEARGTQPGIQRDKLLRLARQAETGAHMSEWLSSPELRPPTAL
jgi:hypothetical protein